MTDRNGRELLPGHLVRVVPESLIADVHHVDRDRAMIGMLRREWPGNFYPGWTVETLCWMPSDRVEIIDPIILGTAMQGPQKLPRDPSSPR